MSEKLKPCPFCGGNAELYSWTADNTEHYRYYRVGCKKCYAGTLTYCNMDIAIISWNKRANELKKPELKPCPFCGNESRILSVTGRNHYVICNYCESRTSEYRTPEDAIDAWNSRAYENA